MRFLATIGTYIFIRRWVESGQFTGTPSEQANSAETADRIVAWLERQDAEDAEYFLNIGMARVYEAMSEAPTHA